MRSSLRGASSSDSLFQKASTQVKSVAVNGTLLPLVEAEDGGVGGMAAFRIIVCGPRIW